MRLSILVGWGAALLGAAAPVAEKPLRPVALGPRTGYVLSEGYATENQNDLVEGIPGLLRVDGFWSPSDTDIVVADRVFHESIQSAAKDPTLLFPALADANDPGAAAELAQQQAELAAVAENYDSYQRQYVGITVDGTKLIFCNYVGGSKADPATGYIFIQKTFVPNGSVHFLQCRFDPDAKTCSNVSMIGSWRGEGR